MPPRPCHRVVLLALLTALLAGCGGRTVDTESLMSQSGRDAVHSQVEEAVLGGGCFWCTEAVFGRVDGVSEVMSGYAGGRTEDPTYEQVVAGTTGHAEVVRIRFDPSIVPYVDLLRVFFATHDPTTPNRQGNDVGSQYRSIILPASPEQTKVAEAVKRELEASGAWAQPIVTQIVPLDRFWPAEEYHQRYFARNPYQGYCAYVIRPKLEKFEKAFRSLLR